MSNLITRNGKPNVIRGGIARQFAPGLFYMNGRTHAKGGIDIGKNPRTGVEVENGEVVQLNKNGMRVFSAMPFLTGESPASLVANGADPDIVFAAQENFKDRFGINDDGTMKAEYGLKVSTRGDDDNKYMTFKRMINTLGKLYYDAKVKAANKNNVDEETISYYPSLETVQYIKGKEAFRPNIYHDGKGIPTIGYGTTQSTKAGKNAFKLYGKTGMTEEQASSVFNETVREMLPNFISATPNFNRLNDNQRNALFSYYYNVGHGGYTRKSPKLQQALKDFNLDEVVNQMDFGYYDTKNSGLRKRRDEERALFNMKSMGGQTNKNIAVQIPKSQIKIIRKINSSKANFVDRLKNPNRKYIKDWESNKVATHKLGVGNDINDNVYIYPEVQEIDGKLIDFTRPPYHIFAGQDSAEQRGDTVRVDNIDDAIEFTQNYKKYYPNFEYKMGGQTNKNIAVQIPKSQIKIIRKINSSKANFVDRLKNPNRKYIKDWESNKVATHKLGVGNDINDNVYIYPEVQEIDGKLIDFTRPPYHIFAGQDSAEQRGDTVRVDNIDDAIEFTQNYKKYYPNFEYKMGGIHIDKNKRGTFTAAATKHGMGVQEFASKVLANKEDYSPAMVKKANFARNASRWKKPVGGIISINGNVKNGLVYTGRAKAPYGIGRFLYAEPSIYGAYSTNKPAFTMLGMRPGWSHTYNEPINPLADFVVPKINLTDAEKKAMDEVLNPVGISGQRARTTTRTSTNGQSQSVADTPVWDDIFNETVIGERPAVSPRTGRLSDNYKLTIPDRIIRGGEITPPEYRADITNGYIDGNFDGEVSKDRQPETDTTGGGFNLKDPAIIGAGINMLGTLGSYLINKNILNKARPKPTNVRLTAQKLKTRYNINPQLDELREQAAANNRLINNNTASSRTALGRMNLINTALGRSRAELYGNKENRETELINQDILNSQNVGNQQAIYNAQLRADYQNRLDDFNRLKLANNSALFSGLTGGVNSIVDALLRQRYYNNTIGAIGARNPNVDARIFRDAGVDWSFMYPYSTRNRS